jgi:hypothetical protein
MGKTFSTGLLTNGIWQDASNNIGIGGSPSGSFKFEVTGTGRFTGALIAANGSFNMSSAVPSPVGISAWDNTVSLFGGITTTSNALALGYNTTNNASYILSAQPGVAWRTMWFGASDYKFTVGQGSIPSMTITSTGNVGIGTSSPSTPLYVVGAMKCETGLYFNNTGANGAFVWQEANTPLRFATNDTERMRINSEGNVGIGNPGNNALKLAISGKDNGSSNSTLYCENTIGAIFQVRNDGNIRMNSAVFGNTTSGTSRTVYIGNGDYFLGGVSSIRKSKKNIQEFTSEWIYDLKPVQFNYRKKDEEGNYTEQIYEEINYGLIAEDTAPIADFLINYNDKEDGTKEMVGIEYMRLITPMLKAIQEQNQLILELSAKVSALENKS